MQHRKYLQLLLVSALLVFFISTCSLPTNSPTSNAGSTDLPAVTSAPIVLPVNIDGAETVLVPGGTYPVGSMEADLLAMPDELPQHNVTLASFYIYTHEVTNATYRACVTAGACLPVTSLPPDMADYASNKIYDEYPVVGVDWNMADAYCRWAGGRLPTEAEWEVAARGEAGNIYPWGDDTPTCDKAGFRGCPGEAGPFRVGSFARGNSSFQAWDMAGNVWEWVNDWYAPTPYTAETLTNPIGSWSGEYKILRGGGRNSSAESLRSAMRLGTSPSDAYGDVGFRCVANPLPVPEAIASTSGGHTVNEDGGGTLDGGGGPSRGRFTWRFVSAACIPSYVRPDENLLAITLEVTETPSPFLWLYVNGEVAPVGGNPIPGAMIQAGRLPDLPAGTPLDIRLQVVNEDGSPIPWATASFTIPMPPPCGATQAPLRHASLAMCSVAPGSSQMFVQVSAGPTMLNYERISVNGIDAVELAPNPRTTTVGRLPDGSVTAGPGTMHILASSTDGTIRYDWTDAVTVPDCSSSASEPQFTLTPTCNGAGGYTVDIRVTPADFPIRGFDSPDGTLLPCRRTGPGQFRCSNVPAESNRVSMIVLLPPGTMIGGSPLSDMALTMDAPTCPEAPATGLWGLRVVCDPDHPDGTVIAGVEFPERFNVPEPLTWATVGGEPNYINMVGGSGGVSGLRAYYSVPPSMTSVLSACARTIDVICHNFTNFESLRTAAQCGAPASEEWALQVSCAAQNPTQAYDVTITYPATYAGASNCTFLNGHGLDAAGIGGNMDPSAHSCVVLNYQQRWLTPGREVGIIFNLPDGSLVGHEFGDVGASLPASCGGEGCTLQRAYCTEDDQAAYITYPSNVTIEYISARAGIQTFTCFDYRDTNPYHLVCLGPITPVVEQLEITYFSGGESHTVTFPTWVTTAPRACPTPVPSGGGNQPPPSGGCLSYTAVDPCTQAGCFWWSDNICHADHEASTAPSCGYGDKGSCASAGCTWDPINSSCGP